MQNRTVTAEMINATHASDPWLHAVFQRDLPRGAHIEHNPANSLIGAMIFALAAW